jgi:hypothetical protein
MSEIMGNKPRRAKRSLALPVVIAGGVSSLLLAFSLTPTFSALTAAIQNTTNTAGTGTLVMQETNATGTVLCNSTDGGTVSTNSATCATINKYGGDLAMVPGGNVTTTVIIKNTGTVAASSFSLAPGTCAQSNNGSANGTATDLCSKYTITIKSGTTVVYSGTAAAFTATQDVFQKLSISTLAANTSLTFTIDAKLDSAVGNTYQGLKISQPLTWTFGA